MTRVSQVFASIAFALGLGIGGTHNTLPFSVLGWLVVAVLVCGFAVVVCERRSLVMARRTKEGSK